MSKQREAFEAHWAEGIGKVLELTGDEEADATCRIAKIAANKPGKHRARPRWKRRQTALRRRFASAATRNPSASTATRSLSRSAVA